MADRSEIKDRLGPGDVAPTRQVTFKCSWPGKRQFMVGNFVVDKNASEDSMREQARLLAAKFTLEHFPDGVEPPQIHEIIPGALRWVPDDSYWRK